VSPKLSKKDVRDFVFRYLDEDKHYKRKVWGPFDDFCRFCLVAASMRTTPLRIEDVARIDAIEAEHPPVAENGSVDASDFAWYVASVLHAINPVHSETRWAQLFWAVMRERKRRNPGYARIRQEPALGKRLDALWMSTTQLRAKYPKIGRTRAYALKHEAVAYYRKPLPKK
jgi:hypothetical protein